MNKICTSLEQSKKLMELGIDVDTSDMYWKNGVSYKYIQCFTPFVNSGTDIDYDYDIPAWSLSALLELMNVNEYKMALKYGNCSEYTMCFDDNYTFNSITKNDAIDSVFKMLVWLKENKKL